MASNTAEAADVDYEPSSGYALSGKIMLSAIIILFAVVIFMVGLHLYARWYLVRLRRRQIERRRQRRSGRTHIVLYADHHQQAPARDRGLEPSVLNSLPVFLHSAAAEPPQQLSECAVCLSEFEEKEIVRLLPKCNHSFHIECIDMWFHSHSTCPLCRSPVEAVVKQVEPDVGIPEPAEPGLYASCQECGTTSSGGARKGLEVRIEVPPRRFPFENESGQGSPAGRFLSRIISMGRKSPMGSGSGGGGYTPCGAGTSGGSGGEFDLESGISETARTPK